MFEVKEKPRLVEKAYLVAVILREEERANAESLLDELEELVSNLGIIIFCKKVVRVRKTFPGYLLGKGKFNEVIEDVGELGCDVIIFDNELSPSQQRNWEAESKVLVIDRQEIILDVFAARAQTKEAVLQVKLARLEYSLPRLRRAWTHLGRQRGGGVTQRGEGEAQIELDQRLVRDQISATKKEIKQVAKTRKTSRKKRLRIPLPTVALVGYTNAGKSTLLNQVCNSDVLSADKLFATLDPTTRQVELPLLEPMLMTDTVGFIQKLPTHLVDSFKATLEEVVEADLLLHVVDASHPQVETQLDAVHQVLDDIGGLDKPMLYVFNKIDEEAGARAARRLARRFPHTASVSAKTGEGMDSLMEGIGACLKGRTEELKLSVPLSEGRLLALLQERGVILASAYEGRTAELEVRVSPQLAAQCARFRVS